MPISEAHYIDCMEFMSRQPAGRFSWGVPDPPYGIGESSKNHKSRNTPITQKNGNILRTKQPEYGKSNWDDAIPPPEYFTEHARVTTNQIIWGSNYFPSICGTPFRAPRRHEYAQFIKEHPTNWIIWDKVNGGNDFNDCELAWVSISIPTEIFYFMWNGMMQGVSASRGTLMQGNKKLNEKRIHPTQKPLALYQWIGCRFLKLGDSWLDTHMGSQNSRISAWKMGFDYYGCEKDKKHYDDGSRRFAHETSSPLFDAITAPNAQGSDTTDAK